MQLGTNNGGSSMGEFCRFREGIDSRFCLSLFEQSTVMREAGGRRSVPGKENRRGNLIISVWAVHQSDGIHGECSELLFTGIFFSNECATTIFSLHGHVFVRSVSKSGLAYSAQVM